MSRQSADGRQQEPEHVRVELRSGAVVHVKPGVEAATLIALDEMGRALVRTFDDNPAASFKEDDKWKNHQSES